MLVFGWGIFALGVALLIAYLFCAFFGDYLPEISVKHGRRYSGVTVQILPPRRSRSRVSIKRS